MRWSVLLALTAVNILNYIDRNIFSALMPAIKNDLGFTDTQLGLLGSAFIFSYTIIAPVFGYFGDRGHRTKMMSGGLLLWSVATAFSGLTVTYAGQRLTRIVVGLGEAAYSVISPSVIADSFPRSARGKVFAIYSCAIPVGSALGYVLGGLLEPRIGWQKSFFVVGVPGVIIAVVMFFMKDPKRGVSDASLAGGVAPSGEIVHMPVVQTYRRLFGNGGFLFTVLGYAAYTFVVGGLAFWMPSYIVRYFEGVSLEKGNLVFGGVTVLGGFIGTVLGGWWADRIEKKSGNGYLKISVISMVLTVPLFAFALMQKSFTSFAVVLFFTDVAMFMCISPLDTAVMNYVRPQFRATASAMNIFLIHALGDGISRTLMGAVSDVYGLQAAVSLMPWVLALAGLIWSIVVIGYWQPLMWPEGALKLPRFQAHRGYRPQGVVENTLAAFQGAKSSGAEMVECDVQRSRDGEVVVFHDADLKRLGLSDDLVSSLTAAELASRVGVPTLRQLLKDPSSPSLVNIELKTSELRDSGLERAVVAVVRECEAEGRVLFSSFNPFSLRRLSQVAPSIPRALLVSEAPEPKNKIYLRRMWLGFLARPHLVHLDQAMITNRRFEEWSDRGLPVAAWTVNDASRAAELTALGVRSVITDGLYASVR